MNTNALGGGIACLAEQTDNPNKGKVKRAAQHSSGINGCLGNYLHSKNNSHDATLRRTSEKRSIKYGCALRWIVVMKAIRFTSQNSG
jgi:hypothetical protein